MSAPLVHHDELLTLLAAHCDAAIDPASCARLDALLQSDPAARSIYLRYIALHAALARNQTLRLKAASASAWRAADDSQTPTLSGASPRSVWYLAALIMLAAALLYVFLPSTPHSPLPAPHAAAPASYAILSDLSNDAAFADGERSLGEGLTAPIKLVSGKAQLMFQSTAVVDLTGPCELAMTGPNRARLMSGCLEAYCRPEAHGFTVDLPGGARVVDLGTAFTILVEADGCARIAVDQGRVEVRQGAASRQFVAGERLTLIDGRIDESGLFETFSGDQLPPTLQAVASTPVAVKDGVVRFDGSTDRQRNYVRTLRSDWTAHSFTARITVHVKDRTAVGLAHFGLSNGRINPRYFFSPTSGPHLIMALRTDNDAIDTYNANNDSVNGQAGAYVRHAVPGGTPAPAVYQIAMHWNAATRSLTCDLDRDADGSIEKSITLDGSDIAFDAANARIVFGGAGGLTFDNLIITQGDPSPPDSIQITNPAE
ncbi:MAG: hypothetical protein GC162_04685 [Planctomycetes bacterium]|nr:hypothetical protein [Planctomycetota bacterium]